MNTYQPPKAFISHASDDKERFVRKFAERLRANGVDAWLDEWEINPGDSPVRKIFDEGLSQCQIVILVMSARSVKKLWVRAELDAAFVNKFEGRTTTLIPLQLDNCEMPAPLLTTRWESVADLDNYDSVFEKVLNGIFGNYPKPEIGPPPAYVQKQALSMGSLTRVDSQVFEKACRLALTQGHSGIDVENWLPLLAELQLTEDQIAESQSLLEEERFIEVQRTIGPHKINGFNITLHGFEQFARVAIPDYEELNRKIAALIVQQEDVGIFAENHSIAQELKQPLMLVDHVLERLERRSLVDLLRENGGYYLTVNRVSAKLRRAIAQ